MQNSEAFTDTREQAPDGAPLASFPPLSHRLCDSGLAGSPVTAGKCAASGLMRQTMTSETNRRDAVAFIVVLALTVSMGFAGLVLDGGQAYAAKARHSADACALAGHPRTRWISGHGREMCFMRMPGFGTRAVSAVATVTLAPTQGTLPRPILTLLVP